MSTNRRVRAKYTDSSITVYQAYPPPIADAALLAGAFVPPFKRERMTWIKPSFLWMMYRSGWATKPGQERVLAITISREGFEWALAHASLSHYDRGLYASARGVGGGQAVQPGTRAMGPGAVAASGAAGGSRDPGRAVR